ncbi:hypothetical protein L2E82_12187 [Cichorium intybus]|uniref:Uncharacterized protein n=1 Tax=Cichorium intybus TaxID=13427 RepID=A0ACB9GEU9_CICIN|nr:hypothetical protein L2E82_12187 [Cichorium intybus]
MMKVENDSPQKSVSSFSDALNIGIREPVYKVNYAGSIIGTDIRVILKGLNGIFADETGLGKIIQAMAFLAHLVEVNEKYFRRVKWHYMILDEAQAIKSYINDSSMPYNNMVV